MLSFAQPLTAANQGNHAPDIFRQQFCKRQRFCSQFYVNLHVNLCQGIYGDGEVFW